jgi:multicomponent Na+:H+ antiporter subunit G
VRTVSEVLVVAGAAWSLLAAVGVCRFDDVYARMHASTKSTTLGLLLTLAGAAAVLGGGDAVKVALAGLLLLFTAPIGAHLVGRAVHHAGGDAVRIDTVDELAAADDRPTDEPPGAD